MRGSGPALESYGTRYIFQFTPLHERQPCCRVPHLVLFGISIHASTWEAARQASRHVDALTISIHASTWEAASSAFFSSFWSAFQFTPLHERQPEPLPQRRRTWQFQFTPLHERQHHGRRRTGRYPYFNSRLYMRGSKKAGCTTYQANAFQFTPLHERQPITFEVSSNKTLFQFTPLHERQQRLFDNCGFHASISIHASTWEAADMSSGWSAAEIISIHASTWEAAVE